MAITVPRLRDLRVDNLDSTADDFSAAGKQFGQGEDEFGPGVAARIASGDIWSGGGQEEADITMQINLSALSIGRIEMEAANSTVKAFSAAMSSAQKTLRSALEEAKKYEITVEDDGTCQPGEAPDEDKIFSGDPRDHGHNRQAAIRKARDVEGRIKGAIAFAGIADVSCKGLLDRITAHVFTFSPSADKGVLEENGELLASALYDRDLADTNLEFWKQAEPKPLPTDVTTLEDLGEGVGNFFEYLWEHPETVGELLLDATVAAAGIVLVLLGAGGAVGGVAVSATGVGSVVGVPATAASATAVVAGLALTGAGAYEAAKDIQKVNSQGSSGGSTSGSSGPKPPQKANDVLKHSDEHNGTPPKGIKGGKEYENNPKPGEGKLPEKTADGDAIKYKEYDVDPKVKGKDRTGERLVIGDDGSVWYTNNHYKEGSFTKIR